MYLLRAVLVLSAISVCSCGRSVPASGDLGIAPADAGASRVKRAVRACTVAAQCARGIHHPPEWHLTTPSICLYALGLEGWYQGMLDRLVEPTLVKRLLSCGDQFKGSCDDFFRCFGGNWISFSYCRYGGRCHGKKVTRSVGTTVQELDCDALGARCAGLVSGAQRACCNRKPCPTNSARCESATRGVSCTNWGAYITYDCGPTGRVCSPSSNGFCVGTGAPCKYDTPTTCKGTVASYCAGGKLARHDCAGNPFSSACAVGLPLTACHQAGKQCDISFTGECRGRHLVVCLDGRKVEVDCKSLGWDACEQAGRANPAGCVNTM